MHSLALPCPFAATERCEKYLNSFGQSACCFLDASHQILLVLLTNHTATENGTYLIPDALLPHIQWKDFMVWSLDLLQLQALSSGLHATADAPLLQ